MSDLAARIDAFLAKYPDDLPLEWQRPTPGRRPTATETLATAIGDLVAASERARKGAA